VCRLAHSAGRYARLRTRYPYQRDPGAALKLKEREDALNGRVRILFQPAEENFGGAKSMVRGRYMMSAPSSA
jgi:hypothetical protein